MADEKDNVKVNENTGDVVEVQLDEVIEVGDERHGVHDPLPPERDALAIHKDPTPEEVFGTPNPESNVDLPESDLEGADGRRGPVVRTVTDSGVTSTPEQVFTEVAVSQADSPDEANAAAKAKSDADKKASADDGKSSRNSG